MSEIKLDINLNELFHLSYDFENLKTALGQILKAMQLNNKTCNEMRKMVENQNKDIFKLKQDNDEKDAKIKDLSDQVKMLQQQVKDNKENIEHNTDSINSNTKIINDNSSKIKDHNTRIEALEAKTSHLEGLLKDVMPGDSGLDLESLQNLLNDFKQECDQKFASKDAFSSLEDRVAILEDASKEHQQDIENLKETKADKKDLQELLDKIENLLKEVEEALKWKQPMVQVNNRIDKLEIQIQNLLNNMGKNQITEDPDSVKQLQAKLDQLRDDFEKFKNDVMQWLKSLQDALEGKADESALKELEKYLLGRLEDLANSLDQRFADKNETKKALKALEKQIKNLFDLLMSQRPAEGEDDAMFAKKPLGGWSCAS